tara:strand:+ start:1128 stop:1796 length:669 start_codon:yes stop_codon:yes gene_type:complete
MAYFDEFPDILLPSFSDGRNSSSDFSKSKNLFKRAKIRDDFFQTATVFGYYSILGDDRPDNVAKKLYDDPSLDWVVLISNNIINVRDEWPMSQYDLERYLDNKYSPEQLQQIHHYETKEVRIHPSMLLLEKGLHVDESFKFRYTDFGGEPRELSGSNLLTSVTHYQYEVAKNDEKRKIYTLRPNFLDTVFADMREIMTYTNSSQFIDNRTKQGDNLRVLSPR